MRGMNVFYSLFLHIFENFHNKKSNKKKQNLFEHNVILCTVVFQHFGLNLQGELTSECVPADRQTSVAV